MKANYWDGNPVRCGRLSFVLAPADPGSPGPVLAAVGTDTDARLVRAEDWGPFLHAHPTIRLVTDHGRELFRTVRAHLSGRGDQDGVPLLRRLVADGRLEDVGLLDQLVRLAEDGTARPPRRSLPDLAATIGGATLPTDPGAEGLVARAQILARVFTVLLNQARKVRLASSAPRTPDREVIPALALQVQADVALVDVGSDGLVIAPGLAERLMTSCEELRRRSEAVLLEDRDAHRWRVRGPKGTPQYGSDGVPRVRGPELSAWLGDVARSVRDRHSAALRVPLGPDGRPSQDPDEWAERAPYGRLLRAWADLTRAPRVAREFLTAATGPVRLDYQILPGLRARVPDLKMIRRLVGPGVFRPTPGHWFLIIRFPDLDLRALAVICQRRFGRATLFDLFSAGVDPVEWVAATLAGRDPSDRTAPRDPSDARWLGLARALLWAAPRGVAPEAVREVARGLFGREDLGLSEVAAGYTRFLDVVPELGDFLQDDTLNLLAEKLQTTPASVQSHLGGYFPTVPGTAQLRGWFSGELPVSPFVRERLGALLEHCGNPEWRTWFESVGPSPAVARTLFGRSVTTPTGRIRGGLLFAEARTAEFLDTADDARKAAAWGLSVAGYRVVAVAETEVVLLPTSQPEEVDEAITRAEAIARSAAEQVLLGVQAVCEGRVADAW